MSGENGKVARDGEASISCAMTCMGDGSDGWRVCLEISEEGIAGFIPAASIFDRLDDFLCER